MDEGWEENQGTEQEGLVQNPKGPDKKPGPGIFLPLLRQ